MAEENAVDTQEVAVLDADRPPSRRRKLRPNGEFYSPDPKTRMAQLQEDGKLGPQYGHLGGRPRKPRASERIAEEARKNADRISEALTEALNSDEHRHVMDAIDRFVQIEREEAKLQIQEDEFDQMTADQMLEAFRELANDPVLLAAMAGEDEDVVVPHATEYVDADEWDDDDE